MEHQLEQAKVLFAQGTQHFESGRLEQARDAFQAALALAPGRPSVTANLGITLFRLGQTAEAIPLLEQATRSDPGNENAWRCLLLAYEEQGNWVQALACVEHLLECAPQEVDLWFKKGILQGRMGQIQEALQSLDQTLQLNPRHGDAWSARGGLLRELNRLAEAAASFRRALACGADQELNAYYLASVTGSSTAAPPRRYVESLFDDYADDFQRHVVDQLHYEGYTRLLQPLLENPRRFRSALDLGCGTGLCAPLLKELAQTVVGVDISQAMLEKARTLNIYSELIHADISAYLAALEKPVDLIVAADVFIYVGELNTVLRSAFKVVAPGGWMAFSVESPPDEGTAVQLLPSLRYAHSLPYVQSLAQHRGFSVEAVRQAPLRYDQGKPVPAYYVYLSKPEGPRGEPAR